MLNLFDFFVKGKFRFFLCKNGRFPTIPHIHKHYVKQRRDLYEAKVIDTLRCSSRRGIINKTNIQKRFCPPPHTSPPPPFWAVSFFCVLFSIFTESHGLLSWLLSCYYIHGDPQQTDPSYLSWTTTTTTIGSCMFSLRFRRVLFPFFFFLYVCTEGFSNLPRDQTTHK